MIRPVFNPDSGGRIRYADSPQTDQFGNRIVYHEDRSNPNAFNQQTGEPVGVGVTVNVQPNAQQVNAAPAPQAAPQTVRVTRLADGAFDTYPSFDVPAGQTVGVVRNAYATRLALRNTMIAIVDGDVVGEGHVLTPGSALTFREGNKARG